MIDEKKLIENILCDDEIKFNMDFDVTTPESFRKSLQEFTDRIKGGIIRLVEAQPKILFGVDLAHHDTAWIPVTERLPDKYGWYLCFIRPSAFHSTGYHTILPYDQHGFRTGYVYTDDVTHWMPLPKPPKDGEAR